MFTPTPLETRVYDTLHHRYLDCTGHNTFENPVTGETDGLSVFLDEPSRYKIVRWTGELLIDGTKVFVGDVLSDKREDPDADPVLYAVHETGSRIYVVSGATNGEFALQLFLSSTPTVTHTGVNLVEGSPVPEPVPA